MSAAFFCYGDEENACIYAVHLTVANQSVSWLCYDIEYQKSGVYKYAIL